MASASSPAKVKVASPVATKGEPRLVPTENAPLKSRAVGMVVSVQELRWLVWTVRVRASGSRTTEAGTARCQ